MTRTVITQMTAIPVAVTVDTPSTAMASLVMVMCNHGSHAA